MKLALLSHTAIGGSFVVGSHHLARSFARAGHNVVHMSAAVSWPHLGLAAREPFVRERLRRWWRGGEMLDGVHDIVPFAVLPWPIVRRVRSWHDYYARTLLASPRSPAPDLQSMDALVIDEPRFVGLARERPGRTLIYRATDLYAAMRGDPAIAEAEQVLCQRADLLIATSRPVADHLERLSGKHVHVIANGVDYAHFAGFRATETAVPGLPGDTKEERLIYVGAFDNRFGSTALLAAAKKHPSKKFLLAGPGSREVAQRLSMPNVFGLGAVGYSMLPGLLHQCAVGLLPMSGGTSNAGRSPMKLYEYAAAGLTIAATGTPELRRRTLPGLVLADGDEGFAHAVSEAFHLAKSDAVKATSREVARGEGWEKKAGQVLALIDRTHIA